MKRTKKQQIEDRMEKRAREIAKERGIPEGLWKLFLTAVPCPSCGGQTCKELWEIRGGGWHAIPPVVMCKRFRCPVERCPGDRRSGEDRRAEPERGNQHDFVEDAFDLLRACGHTVAVTMIRDALTHEPSRCPDGGGEPCGATETCGAEHKNNPCSLPRPCSIHGTAPDSQGGVSEDIVDTIARLGNLHEVLPPEPTQDYGRILDPRHEGLGIVAGPTQEPVARFFRLVRLHSHEVPTERLGEHRVPPGTRLVGRLYIAPDGELVVTDGYPNDEVADDHPDVHNCDEMGCSTASHVVARLAPHGATEPTGGER